MNDEPEREDDEGITETHSGPQINVVAVETSGSALITVVIIICVTILFLGLAGGGM